MSAWCSRLVALSQASRWLGRLGSRAATPTASPPRFVVLRCSGLLCARPAGQLPHPFFSAPAMSSSAASAGESAAPPAVALQGRVAGTGLAACQYDSYLRTLDTRVVSSTEIQVPADDAAAGGGGGGGGGAGGKGKGKQAKKKGKKGGQPKLVTVHEIVLEDTCLFPEGGGQPCDHGTIAGVPVRNVLRNPDGFVVHHSPQPFEPGAAVTVELDWERRFDNMQQHSSQHLISAVADAVFGFHTTSWGLLAETTTIDLDCSAEDLAGKVDELERRVNQYIREGVPLRAKEYAIPEAMALPDLRIGKKGLPADLERIRIVCIDGLESNACCGTHVRSLAHLQAVKFCGVNKTSRGSLLTFMAGGRVLRYLGASLAREQVLNKALACGPPQYAAALERLKADLKDQTAAQKRLVDELNGLLAETLLQRASAPGAAGFAHLHRDQGDPKQLSRLGSMALEAGPDSARLFLLTCGDRSVPSGPGSFVLVGRDAAEVKTVGAAVAGVLGGRGGGSKGIFQGKAPSLANLQAAVEAASAGGQQTPEPAV